jgi:hypothetical protein
MEEATIRQKIQETLQHGALPIHAQAAPEASRYSHVGEGTGEPCSACDEPITPHEERVIYADLLRRLSHAPAGRWWAKLAPASRS